MSTVLIAIVAGLLAPQITITAAKAGKPAGGRGWPWADPVGRRAEPDARVRLQYDALWKAPLDPDGRPYPDTATRDRLLARGGPADLAASSRLLQPQPGPSGESWAALGFREDDIRRNFGRQFDLEWAKLNAKCVLVDPAANPYVPLRRTGWKTEESLNLPLPGSFFVVSQVGVNSGSVEWQQYEVVGRTGLGVRLPSWLGGEVQLRGGRSLANYDPDDEVMFADRVTRFIELTSRWPVVGRINLEYTGKAIPAQAPHERDVIRQEVKLAIPISESGQFHIGARYRWEDAGPQSPWIDRTKMFLGLQLKR